MSRHDSSRPSRWRAALLLAALFPLGCGDSAEKAPTGGTVTAPEAQEAEKNMEAFMKKSGS